jgi:hypothetical protein
MLAETKHDLYVGTRLNAMNPASDLVRCSTRVVSVTVTNNRAAKMFSMNLHTWKHNVFVKKNYPAAAIRRLEKNLNDLAATPTNARDIEWRLRQLVYERKT